MKTKRVEREGRAAAARAPAEDPPCLREPHYGIVIPMQPFTVHIEPRGATTQLWAVHSSGLMPSKQVVPAQAQQIGCGTTHSPRISLHIVPASPGSQPAGQAPALPGSTQPTSPPQTQQLGGAVAHVQSSWHDLQNEDPPAGSHSSPGSTMPSPQNGSGQVQSMPQVRTWSGQSDPGGSQSSLSSTTSLPHTASQGNDDIPVILLKFARSVAQFEQLNAQEQPPLVWPPSFALARAYADQLARSNGLAPDRIATVRNELIRAERLTGQQRRDALTQLATRLESDAQSAADQAKVRMLAGAVRELAGAAR